MRAVKVVGVRAGKGAGVVACLSNGVQVEMTGAQLIELGWGLGAIVSQLEIGGRWGGVAAGQATRRLRMGVEVRRRKVTFAGGL